MPPRFQGAAHSMCVSEGSAGQGGQAGAGGLRGAVVLPTSPGRGAGAEAAKLLEAPMAGVHWGCQRRWCLCTWLVTPRDLHDEIWL